MHAGAFTALWASLLAAPAVASAPGQSAPAPGVSLDHQPVACVVAGTFPTLEACVRPKAGRTLAYFRAGGTSDWYYVQMKEKPGAESCLVGVLPKPRTQTRAVEYYLEAISAELGGARSREFSAVVVGAAGECGERPMAVAGSVASVVVSAPLGAPALPPGFSPVGIASAAPAGVAGTAAAPAAGAGGGMSGSTLALVVGGGVAVAAGAAVALGGGGSDSNGSAAVGASPAPAATTTTTTTTTTAPPGPTAVLAFVGGSPPPGSSVQDPGSSFVLTLRLDVSAQCSAAVPNARLFATLRRAAGGCVTSYADFSLAAASARVVSVQGFVVAAECRPVPFTTDSLWLRLYDMNGSLTVPLGEATVAVSYRIVP